MDDATQFPRYPKTAWSSSVRSSVDYDSIPAPRVPGGLGMAPPVQWVGGNRRVEHYYKIVLHQAITAACNLVCRNSEVVW